MGSAPEKRNPGGPDGAPAVLSDRQWAYLQRRYELTRRERQVAELVCRGQRNSSIATRLKVRPETVKTHVRNIYRKTGVKGKVLLVLRFITDADRSPHPRMSGRGG